LQGILNVLVFVFVFRRTHVTPAAAAVIRSFEYSFYIDNIISYELARYNGAKKLYFYWCLEMFFCFFSQHLRPGSRVYYIYRWYTTHVHFSHDIVSIFFTQQVKRRNRYALYKLSVARGVAAKSGQCSFTAGRSYI